jgi:hypothetical protein
MPDVLYTDDDVLAPTEAARFLHPNLHARTLERWRTVGSGPPFIKVGRRVGYRVAALRRFKQQAERTHTGHTPEGA